MTDVSAKVAEIAKNSGLAHTNLVIRVECPLLDTGVRVLCRANEGGVVHSRSISGGVKDFYVFAREYREANPRKQFNVITFQVNPNGTFTTDATFEKQLQIEAEENTQ